MLCALTRVDVMMIIIINVVLISIYLYKAAYSAKTGDVAKARQIHKLYSHDQPTAFVWQRQ